MIGFYTYRTICDVHQSTLLLSASLVAAALKSLVGFESMRGSSVSIAACGGNDLVIRRGL